ncbi:NfeD family protein [Tuanshanicoccus lijuaniae]|uniref:NfeD family protein n=1 Tax=Aerococcaceae bacterium zg-1292 TaxID=2774330 RepID=UPI001BD7F92F|nr:hypothetical protein [Aerococcaceae bacterium zg-BR22]MBS4456490.1 hypothetical protein [Aerococcaceae bacterium zg-A91]MBS4458591.1 hypothetical protein [Aerococcaceae bacterium zg-BR33]
MILWLLSGVVVLTIALFSVIRYKWINAIIATVLFAIYFNVFTLPSLTFLIFMIGIVLLVVELYIPDFGIVGIIGFMTTVIALYLLLGDVTALLTTIIYCVLAVLLVIFIGFKLGYELSLSPRFVLTTSLNRQAGYVPAKEHQGLLGQIGEVIEDLRPVGKIRLNDSQEVVEAMSQLGMLKRGTPVVVNKVVGSKIYVKYFERVGE